MTKQCKSILTLGELEICCDLETIATGPIIDEVTGQRLGPYIHVIGGRNSYHSHYMKGPIEQGEPLIHITWSNDG